MKSLLVFVSVLVLFAFCGGLSADETDSDYIIVEGEWTGTYTSWTDTCGGGEEHPESISVTISQTGSGIYFSQPDGASTLFPKTGVNTYSLNESEPDGDNPGTYESTTTVTFSSETTGTITQEGDHIENGVIRCHTSWSVTLTAQNANPDPVIESITITGPTTVEEETTVSYSLKANFSDGTSENITSEADWSVDSPYASIDANGTLTALSVTADQVVTITATYEGFTATHMITIQDSFAQAPERILPVAVYRFEEGDKPTGSVALGDGVTVAFAGDIEVGIIDNHLGFYLGRKPVQSLMAVAAAPGEAANLSFTFEEPIQAFTVLAADYDGNTTISAYDSGNQLVETVQVKGATAGTYELASEQSIAKVVISSSSGWVGTTEELAVLAGRVLSQLNGSPIQGVTVSISPSNRQGVSDSSGNYTISGVKPGTYSLTGTGTNIETITVTGIAVIAGATVTQDLTASPSQGGTGDPDSGYQVTADLWAKAILEVSGSPVPLVWKEVGADVTPSGDQVISGYFYADPNDFAYGSLYNPELFVKIYISTTGWCNIAFNHVTVDPVSVYSAHQYAGAADQTGSATLQTRLVEHEYTGVAIDTTKQSSGGTSAAASGSGYTLGSNLWSQAVLQVTNNPVTLIWKEVGTDTTPSGAKVISGYFYADTAAFAYGSQYNPEVFVKVYIDQSGWTNMAFNHVTVDPVSIDSAYGYAGVAQTSGSATLNERLLQHEYTGVSAQ